MGLFPKLHDNFLSNGIFQVKNSPKTFLKFLSKGKKRTFCLKFNNNKKKDTVFSNWQMALGLIFDFELLFFYRYLYICRSIHLFFHLSRLLQINKFMKGYLKSSLVNIVSASFPLRLPACV